MKLISDFNDWYDIAFDGRGKEFYRISSSGMPRPKMLKYLKTNNFNVPLFGRIKMLSNYPIHKVVIHSDLRAHQGIGKILITIDDAIQKYPNYFGVEFIVPDEKGCSYRFLKVGWRRWWIKYLSTEDWRSNCGDGDYEVLEKGFDDYLPQRLPDFPVLVAIDFIFAGNRLWAIDYNIAPGLQPLNGYISPFEIIELLEGK